MKKYKLDWDRIRDENLIKNRGVEYPNKKKPLEIIEKITCRYCRTRFDKNDQKTEIQHLETCLDYIEQIRKGREIDRFGIYRRFSNAGSISSYLEKPDFPFCTLNKYIKTKNFTGKVFEVTKDGKKIKILNDFDELITFDIAVLLEIDKKKSR